jgi:hypothetical protein
MFVSYQSGQSHRFSKHRERVRLLKDAGAFETVAVCLLRVLDGPVMLVLELKYASAGLRQEELTDKALLRYPLAVRFKQHVEDAARFGSRLRHGRGHTGNVCVSIRSFSLFHMWRG